jgi:hypothetical protein
MLFAAVHWSRLAQSGHSLRRKFCPFSGEKADIDYPQRFMSTRPKALNVGSNDRDLPRAGWIDHFFPIEAR